MKPRLHDSVLFALLAAWIVVSGGASPSGQMTGGLASLQSQQVTVAGRIIGSKVQVQALTQLQATVLASDVNLTQACSPQSFVRGDGATCTIEVTNTSFEPRAVDLDSVTSKHLDVLLATGATRLDGHHVQVMNALLPAAQPGVPALSPDSLFGYVPLDAFGVTPIPIGDEEIINLTTPSFVYGGETFASVSVFSNGYLIPGVGTGEDNNCCSLPNGPDPDRPNNVLAPFWTDLDGTAAPGIFAATLTNGVDSWLVIEFRLNVFRTISPRCFRSGWGSMVWKT
jgi:hypothetical protein